METYLKDYKIKLLLLILGVILGAASFVLPMRYILVLAAGAVFGLFTFYRLDISLTLFIMGMAVIPNDYWNNMFIALAAVFFCGVYALEWLLGKREGIALKYLAPSLVVYVLFCVLSLFTGFGGMDSVRVFVIAFSCILFAVLLPNVIRDEESLNRLILCMMIAITLSALFGLYQYRMGVEIRADYTDLTQSQGLARLFSAMANPNNDAEFWAMFLPFGVAYLLLAKNDIKKIIFAGMLALVLLALVLTSSRSGYLAVVAAAGVFVLLVQPRLVPVGILLFILCIPFLPDAIVARMATIGKDTSSQYRFRIWEGVLRVIKNYWTQGVGMGPTAFSTIYRNYAHPSAGPVMHAHNVLLNTWLETGIGGVIALLAYFIRIAKDSLSTVLKPKNIRMKYFAAAGAASFTAFFVFSLVEYVWFYPRVMLAFWISMGLIHTVYRLNEGGRQ